MKASITNKFDSLQSRLLALFICVLVLVLLVTLLLVDKTSYRHSNTLLMQKFSTAKQVINYRLQTDLSTLRQALSTLAKDFNTKQLIAGGTKDPESLKVALDNHRTRLKSPFLAVVNNSGEVIAASGTQEAKFMLAEAVTDKGKLVPTPEGIGVVNPVKFVEHSPRVNAYLIAGYRLEDLVGEQMRSLTGFELFLRDDASSVHDESGQRFWLKQVTSESDVNTAVFEQKDVVYQQYPLLNWPDKAISLVLMTDKDKAHLSSAVLVSRLLLVLPLSIFLILIASIVMSRGITRPLTALVNVANSISKGKYDCDIPQTSTKEVHVLSSALEVMLEDIKHREKAIQQLAFYDKLTNLPNRNSFKEQIQQSVAREAPFCVMTFDIDRFKEINDTIGHDSGDKVLKSVAQRLRKILLEPVFIAHLGGDEFGVIVEGLAPHQAKQASQAVLALFEMPYTLDGVLLDVDISLGCAFYPEHGGSAEELLKASDIALYSCKGKHQSVKVYDPGLNQHSLQRLNLMSELRFALTKEELCLFYQPKICLASGKLKGAEALIRWHHPQHGFIRPDEFIPLAEQTGAIREVTKWAIRRALTDLTLWQSQGKELQLAVNISAIDLVDLDLPKYVAEIKRQHKGDFCLTLEVTESAVMGDAAQANQALHLLSQLGAKLSIDDFGTGYSSMAQLKSMPVSELKIDRAFVKDVIHSEEDQVMVRSMVELGHNLSLSVVVEGVEDVATFSWLREIGADLVQGYFIAKPMPADEFLIWMNNYNGIENIAG